MSFDLVDAVRTTGTVGFFIAMAGALWLLTKVLDERRGKQPSSLRVLINPFMIARESLTEQGQVWHARFLKVWSVGFGCWVVVVVASVFGR